ncbi:Gonadotropin-releasing hormone II receptor [Portunus trituberculatus]|uniref:Gonadotropin-releasing hormone II receptor n=1 Tax=Portunus trituberculatus TaxID=210409 RepID=A0A5B7IRP9_PORTR|nr:Gonadotropin-releasing hormone II receptor [Portunus trituberculatus]
MSSQSLFFCFTSFSLLSPPPLFSSLLLLLSSPLLFSPFHACQLSQHLTHSPFPVTDSTIRRSSLGYLGRARARTIKMTVSIVLAFFICWTPYVVISLW